MLGKWNYNVNTDIKKKKKLKINRHPLSTVAIHSSVSVKSLENPGRYTNSQRYNCR